MIRHRSLVTCATLVVGLLFLPAIARGQTAGAIAGAVRDATGAVLPGVTVEAASPALIEKVRSVVTDGQGLYDIENLRPGTYTVTFTLPGFTTFKREGIELSGAGGGTWTIAPGHERVSVTEGADAGAAATVRSATHDFAQKTPVRRRRGSRRGGFS